MSIEAIFFDVDGTLVDNQAGCIPSSTIQALEALHKKNIKLFVCTSRCDGEMGNFTSYLHSLPFDGVISAGGAMIHYQDQHIIEAMDKKDIDFIVEYCKSNHLSLRYQSDCNCHVCEILPNHVRQSFIDYYDYVPSVKPYENEKIVNFLGFGTPDDYQSIMNHVQNCGGIAYEDAFEILKKGVSKASGMRKICELLHISLNNTMAIGDDLNDIGMIQEAGIGICMGNGANKVKEVAAYVTTSVNDNGIWNCMKHFNLL